MENQNPRRRRAAAPQRPMKKKKKSRKAIILLIVLLLLFLIGLAVFLVIDLNRDYERYVFDTDAMAGRIQMMTEEEIQAELNRVVEEGMFNISIASSIVFDSPTDKGEARIENIAANNYHMKVEIRLDDTGETVYESRLIQPGYSIEKIALSKRLEPGEYAATATFSAITKEEMQLFGQAGAQIRLYIMDGNGRLPTPSPNP